jgi:hypothetical protein
MGQPSTWQVTIVTPGKLYKGTVFAGSGFDRRTITLLNSPAKASRYSDTAMAAQGYIQLDDVVLTVGGASREFSTVSVRTTEIIFAMDEFRSMGSEAERRAYESWRRTEEILRVSVITALRADRSFQLTGTVHQFKQKFLGKDQFMAMVDVSIEELAGTPGMVADLSEVPFVAVNKSHIEAVILVDKRLAADTA